MPDALQLLREDHNKVKDLFQRFEKTDERSEKKKIAADAIMNLQVHAQIEEEIFYPSMRKQLGDVELLHEAHAEHHVADMIMEELQSKKLGDKDFDAKFTVLAENVKHHIGEEEGEMFPKAAEAGQKALQRVGQQLMERKQELMEEMQRPRKRAASASRNGGSRAGRTSRTTARSRTTSTARGGTSTARKPSSSGTRSRSTSRSSGTRSTSARSSGGSRASSTRARSGGSSRARSTTSSKRATATKRGRTASRSRR